MKVLLLNGSPHEKGCTYTALAEIAKTLVADGVEAEILWLGNDVTYGCSACGACRKLGKCVHDDVVNVAAEKMRTCDGLIVGSPVHYASASGAITSALDRLFYSAGAAMRHKPGAAIVSARRAGTTAALDQLSAVLRIRRTCSSAWAEATSAIRSRLPSWAQGARVHTVCAIPARSAANWRRRA